MGTLANVSGGIKRGSLDIRGLWEVRWKNGGEFVSDGIRVIYTPRDKSVERICGGSLSEWKQACGSK